MEIVAAIALVVLSAAFVALPFLRPEQPLEAQASTKGIAAGEAERHKAEAYAAIKEADFDFQMGKLSETDHAALRDKYAAQALAAMAELDTGRGASAAASAGRPRRVAFCPQCGTEAAKRANFCAGCGTNLKQLAA